MASLCECGEHAFLPIQQGRTAIIDVSDVAIVAEHKWYFARRHDGIGGYAERHCGGRRMSMHRVVMGNPDGFIDHVDGDGLNNRRANLRVASHTENMRNRKRHKTAVSRFKGLDRVKCAGGLKWRARIAINGRRLKGPTRSTEEEAARDYDLMAMAYHGEFARTNGC